MLKYHRHSEPFRNYSFLVTRFVKAAKPMIEKELNVIRVFIVLLCKKHAIRDVINCLTLVSSYGACCCCLPFLRDRPSGTSSIRYSCLRPNWANNGNNGPTVIEKNINTWTISQASRKNTKRIFFDILHLLLICNSQCNSFWPILSLLFQSTVSRDSPEIVNIDRLEPLDGSTNNSLN